MTYVNFIFICISVIFFPILYIFIYTIYLKWKNIKIIKLLKALEEMTLLQSKFYKLKWNGKLQDFKIISQQLENTIIILSRVLEQHDFLFQSVKVEKKFFDKNYVCDFVNECEKMNPELKELLDINNSIIKTILFVKNPIRYQFNQIKIKLLHFILHILIFVLKISEKKKEDNKKEEKLKEAKEKMQYNMLKKEMYLT